jgi:hypothetical protein
MKTCSTLPDVASWLDAVIAGGCCRVVLCHTGAIGERHVAEWHIAAKLDVPCLGEEIIDRICEDGRTRGPTTYGIHAFRAGSHYSFDRKVVGFEEIVVNGDAPRKTPHPGGQDVVSTITWANEAIARVVPGEPCASVGPPEQENKGQLIGSPEFLGSEREGEALPGLALPTSKPSGDARATTTTTRRCTVVITGPLVALAVALALALWSFAR